MSHIRFNRTVLGTLEASVQVHTEQGLRKAAVATMLTADAPGYEPAAYKAVTAELLTQVDVTRNRAGKERIGGQK